MGGGFHVSASASGGSAAALLDPVSGGRFMPHWYPRRRFLGVDHRLDDLQAVPHGARGAIPFGDHQLVAFVEVVKRGGQFGASGHAFAGCGIGIDGSATGTLQRLDLTGEVLILRADAGVADEAFFGFTCELIYDDARPLKTLRQAASS